MSGTVIPMWSTRLDPAVACPYQKLRMARPTLTPFMPAATDLIPLI